ncbi:hypothetical protein B0H12DRAFT_151483 [Mycena haematopus]|nr:hypothetical protein B0H12DRAFT_151483 [Mycena haematopus]
MRRTSFSLVLAASLSNAFVNITVDDADTSLIFFSSPNCRTLQSEEAGGSWQVSSGQFVYSCHNQTLRRCEEARASITFKFTGVAVYLVYPPWPHEMTLSATLDSNPSVFLTLPIQSDETSVQPDTQSSSPVWGLSGLPNREHTLTISRPGDGGLYFDAFMYTAVLCDTPLCRRRRGGTEPEDPTEDSVPIPGSSTPGSSSSPPGSSSSAASFTSIPSASALPSSSSSASLQTTAASSSTSAPLQTALQTTVASQIASSHKGAVGIILGVVLGVLGMAIALSCFFYRRFRRRTRRTGAYKENPAPPYTVSNVSTSELTRPPSMRERSDRFSFTHTPAGTPLTRSPGTSFMTLLSSNSMRWAHLSSSSGTAPQKGGLPETSNHGDDDSDAPLEIPPPRYET